MTRGKRIFNRICMAVTLAAIIILAARTDFSQFGTALSKLNYFWLGIGFLAVLLSWFFDAVVLKRLIPHITENKISIGKSFKYALAFLFYFALTPYGTAGQPMQMMYMVNDGISMGKTSAISGIKLFSDKIGLAVIYTFFMIISGAYFYEGHHGVFWVSILAFALNLIILAGLFLIIAKPSLARGTFKGGIKLLTKLRLIKNPENALAKTDKAIDDYSAASVFIKHNKKKIAELVFFSAMKRMMIFIVPYLLLMAFGIFEYGFITVLALNIFMTLAVTLMPTPGTTLAAEGGFSIIFSTMFGAVIVLAIVIWRLLTYYMVILAGSVMVIGENISSHRNKKKLILSNSFKEDIPDAIPVENQLGS